MGIPLTNVELRLLLVARSISNGKWLYRDIWASSEPLSALVYFIMPRSISAIQTCSYWINVVLLITNAFSFNALLQRFEVLSEKTYLPAFFLLFISLTFVELNVLSTPLMASPLLLFVIGNVLSYLKKEESKKMYDTGFFLGIASLFYLPSLLFSVAILITLLLYTRSVGRSYLLFLLGCSFSWLVLGVIYLVQDGLDDMITIFVQHYFDRKANFISLRNMLYIFAAPLITLFIGFFSSLRSHIREINYQSICRSFFGIWLVCSLVIFFVSPEKSLSLLYLWIFPVTFFYTFYFIRIKKHLIPNLTMFFAVIAMVICQYAFIKKGIWRDSMIKLNVEEPISQASSSNQKVWVAGTGTFHYLHANITTRYFDWEVSQIDLGNTNKFSNIEHIRKNLYADLPEIIIDETDLLSHLSVHIPSIQRDYKQSSPGIYLLQRK